MGINCSRATRCVCSLSSSVTPLAAPVTTLRPRSRSPSSAHRGIDTPTYTWLETLIDWLDLPDPTPIMFAPDVDLVIAFRVSKTKTTRTRREEGRKAEKQYNRLIEALTYAGLKAVGRRGESLGHLLVFVTCPDEVLKNLVVRERRSDFLSGLPVSPVATSSAGLEPLSPSDRIRLVHAYISSTPADGGLGISPDAAEWDLVESIAPLHNRDFNEQWVKVWTLRNIASVQLDKIREQFGEAVAYYFAFLSSYTMFLAFPAALGVFAHFFLGPYHPAYSVLVAIWCTVFVEWWRVHERILALRFGTRNAFRVERRRAQYTPNMPWYQREIRILLTLPVIGLFGFLLTSLLTAMFVFEAFITHLYEGPGKSIVAFSPTILFILLVPRFLAVYNYLAVLLTKWENHSHQSTYAASLTLKTFALGALVSYSGLALSAFVYVPFGEGLMNFVQQRWLKHRVVTHVGVWDVDTGSARKKLNPGRLRDQMFAMTVTNQIIGTFTEVGLPFVLRAVESFRTKKASNGSRSLNSSPDGLKKKVVFEDEQEKGGLEERIYLERVRTEFKLPEYDLFADYNEMVVQFGHVALWSTIWPLAGVMALINNIVELRSDAFKITVHHRRPVPVRTDTIGPWLEALTILTWLSALTNSALVYLFSPTGFTKVLCLARSVIPFNSFLNTVFNATTLTQEGISTHAARVSLMTSEHLVSASGNGVEADDANPEATWGVDGTSDATFGATKDLLVKAALVALVASHVYIVVRALIRHVVEKIWWKGSDEVREREREDLIVKERFLKGGKGVLEGEDEGDFERNVKAEVKKQQAKRAVGGETDLVALFWDHDEGADEIQRMLKEA